MLRHAAMLLARASEATGWHAVLRQTVLRQAILRQTILRRSLAWLQAAVRQAILHRAVERREPVLADRALGRQPWLSKQARRHPSLPIRAMALIGTEAVLDVARLAVTRARSRRLRSCLVCGLVVRRRQVLLVWPPLRRPWPSGLRRSWRREPGGVLREAALLVTASASELRLAKALEVGNGGRRVELRDGGRYSWLLHPWQRVARRDPGRQLTVAADG
jgi:hypothetical protein